MWNSSIRRCTEFHSKGCSFWIAQILAQSHFELVSSVLALEATQLVSELVSEQETQIAVELINNRLISVH